MANIPAESASAPKESKEAKETKEVKEAKDIKATTDESVKFESREEEADAIIKNNVLWATGLGVVPIPLFDFVAVTAVQIRMLRSLSAAFDIPFKEDRVKSICASLIAGLGAPAVGVAVIMSAIKIVPVLGPLAATVAIPGASAAFTYAVGKVFLQHFASGGTFLDFDPDKVRGYFRQQFEEGKLAVSKMRSTKTAA